MRHYRELEDGGKVSYEYSGELRQRVRGGHKDDDYPEPDIIFSLPIETDAIAKSFLDYLKFGCPDYIWSCEKDTVYPDGVGHSTTL